MLDELESLRLEVVLIPQRIHTNEGGCVRCVVSKNAPWYRELCAGYSSTRVRRKAAFDTRIRRANIVRILHRLSAPDSAASRSGYAAHLLNIARNRVKASAVPAADRRALTLKLAAQGAFGA